jgi:hypothetical protein
MSAETFHLPREATIQLSDVYGPLPTDGLNVPPPDDFDAAITSQVRNTGRFHDGEFGISDGGAVLGGYGVVLVDDLRHLQREQALEILEDLGVQSTADLTPDKFAIVHPDDKIRLESLDSAVVVVSNSAPRTDEHHATGRNGSDFYVATTGSGVEMYAQAHMLSSLDARGRITSLRRIPEGVVWNPGEQFRSSVVTDARRKPEQLETIERDDNWPIPPLTDGIKLAYTDKFANVRLETSDVAAHGDVLREADKVDLVLDDGRVAIRGIHVASRMTDIPEGEFGAYFNTADRDAKSGPAYIELVRRVSDPNGGEQHRAYHELAERVGKLLGKKVTLADWNNIVMDLRPSQPTSELPL